MNSTVQHNQSREQQIIPQRPEPTPDQEIRNVSFPVSVRGYDRHAVDEYVKRVNETIAELELSHTTDGAIKHALERVGRQTSGILERAQATANEILQDARQEADETTGRAAEWADRRVREARAAAEQLVAEAEAAAAEIVARARAEQAERLQRTEEELRAMREQGEAMLSELETHTDAIAERHRLLLYEIRELANRCDELAAFATSQLPAEEQVATPRDQVAT